MKKIKATLTALVMAFGVSAGLGTVAATINPVEKSNVVAQAETVVTINVLAQAGDATASAFYAYPTDGTKPTVNDWDNPFTFVAGTGKGLCLNGQQITGWTIKQPGDFYIDFGSPVAAGDMVTLDGKFLCANKDQAVVFNNCNTVCSYFSFQCSVFFTADNFFCIFYLFFKSFFFFVEKSHIDFKL